MAEVDFFCNYMGCRKPLLSSVWITKCSHIFCPEHGDRISQTQACPACNESLLGDLDATYQNLNPPDIFRSMVLAGLRPEVIVDIIARSMAFRTYQMAQERAYYDSTIQLLETQMTKLEAAHKSEITKLQNDIVVLNKRQQQLLTELETYKFRVQEHERILNEKNRQTQLLQMKHEALRCHATFQHFQNQDACSKQPPQQTFVQGPFRPPPPTHQPLQPKTKTKVYASQEDFLQGHNQTFRAEPPNCPENEGIVRGKINNMSFMINKTRPKPRPSPSFPFFQGDKE